MISKTLNIFLQNVRKNRLLTDIILENNKKFDVLFIQELIWSIIQQVLSFLNEEGENTIGTSYHPSWIIFTQSTLDNNKYPRVIKYINIRLIRLRFLLKRYFKSLWYQSYLLFQSQYHIFYSKCLFIWLPEYLKVSKEY